MSLNGNFTNRSYQMVYKPEMEAGTLAVLQASQASGQHTAIVLGREFTILPNVFSPSYFEDSTFFIEHLPVEDGNTVFEVGSGSGAFSVTAACQGALVDASDINPDAVENTRLNAEKHGVAGRVNVQMGNVFELRQGSRRHAPYDIVYRNHPFNLTADTATLLTDHERSVSDPGYEATQRFIAGAEKYLKLSGSLYLGTSLMLGQDNLVFDLLRRAGYQTKITAQDTFDEGGNLIDYTLIRARR